jgi:hypothetical protein
VADQFSQQFRRFCTQRCHSAREKLEASLGGKTSFWKSETLGLGLAFNY